MNNSVLGKEGEEEEDEFLMMSLNSNLTFWHQTRVWIHG